MHASTGTGDSHVPPPGPATRRQLLLVQCCVLVAVALIWYRARLPDWLHLPQREYTFDIATTPGRGFERFRIQSQRGEPLLVVGDSVVGHFPVPNDRIQCTGMSAPEILRYLPDDLRDRRYDTIILWPGSAHFAGGLSAESYVDAVAGMHALALRHADHVYILTPMPVRLRPDAPVHRADTIRQATRILQARLPEAAIYDMLPFHTEALSDRHFPPWTRDGAHLTPAGFAALLPRLEAWGVAWPPPKRGGFFAFLRESTGAQP